MSVVSIFINIVFILSYFFFGAGFEYVLGVKEYDAIAMLCYFIGFVIALGANMIIQARVVNLYKEMNPEKQGSVYDMKFREKWMDSCDEMEKQMIYQCGYKAYQVTSNMCVVLWTVFTCLAMFLKISLWPVGIVSLFWLVLTGTYLAEGRRLEKQRRK